MSRVFCITCERYAVNGYCECNPRPKTLHERYAEYVAKCREPRQRRRPKSFREWTATQEPSHADR